MQVTSDRNGEKTSSQLLQTLKTKIKSFENFYINKFNYVNKFLESYKLPSLLQDEIDECFLILFSNLPDFSNNFFQYIFL